MNRFACHSYLCACMLWLLCVAPAPGVAGPNAPACTQCHAVARQAFAAAHASFAQDCTQCHAGDAAAASKAAAHRGLIAYPGDMDSAAAICGRCHADKVEGVIHSLMHTGAGMVATTRRALGEPVDRPGHNDLSHLTQSPADSLLRKQCASCHLGQPKTAHRLDPMYDRGGGCLACHIDEQTAQAHPALTAQVSDARCFGCHARSGRISLSYAGLAETDDAAAGTGALEDGRRVEFRPADRHHAAGMGCTDCHTEADLMGTTNAPAPPTQPQAVDIRCEDCHRIARTIGLAQWPERYRNLQARIPYRTGTATRFAVTARGTPLWHVELNGDSAWLHVKRTGERLRIPPYRDADHPLSREHARLDCTACHAAWAPQCYGCHLDYTADGQQYDHTEARTTQGRWDSRRSDVRSDPPPLGVRADGRVVPVVPGMILSITHPDWTQPRFGRHFAAIDPHTTGPARSCASCHRSSNALGLGEGEVELGTDGNVAFRPTHPLLQDGLPGDAWTGIGNTGSNDAAAQVRPLSAAAIKRVLAAPLQP